MAGIRVLQPIGPGWEYSLDQINWQESPLFEGLADGQNFTAGTEYAVYSRHLEADLATVDSIILGESTNDDNLERVLRKGNRARNSMALLGGGSNYYIQKTSGEGGQPGLVVTVDGVLNFFAGLLPDGRRALADQFGPRMVWSEQNLSLFFQHVYAAGYMQARNFRMNTKVLTDKVEGFLTGISLGNGEYEIMTSENWPLLAGKIAPHLPGAVQQVYENDSWTVFKMCKIVKPAPVSDTFGADITPASFVTPQPHTLNAPGSKILGILLDENGRPDMIRTISYPTNSTYLISYPAGSGLSPSATEGGEVFLKLKS